MLYIPASYDVLPHAAEARNTRFHLLAHVGLVDSEMVAIPKHNISIVFNAFQ